MTQTQRQHGLPRVTVFGAGVAGLTAAHELAERGFQVEVIDPAINEYVGPHTLDTGIGGMARSQYSFRPPASPPEMVALWPARDFLLDETFVFDGGAPADPTHAADLIRRLAALVVKLSGAGQLINCLSVVAPVEAVTDAPNARLHHVRTRLAEALPEGLRAMVDQIHWIEIVAPDPASHRWAYVQCSWDIFPGEHGFRFFPSFYRHLFDTMKRIRILTPWDSERTRATVFENLVPTEGLGFARDGRRASFFVPRQPIWSFETVRHYLELVLSELQYTPSDIARFQLKLFKYMTSCVARRRDHYERTSWGQFVEQQRYSPVSRRHIENGPQMSAALKGSQSDARTQGNITVQLLLDQIRKPEICDGTLDGPTNGAWFGHWREYLEAQGVQFRRGRLTGFHREGEDVVPVVEPRDRVDGDPSKLPPLRASGDVFVLALSLPELYRIAPSFLDADPAGRAEDSDFARILRFGGPDLFGDLARAEPTGPLEHLSGIQYYFSSDVRFWRGHTQYLDSAWGLTSIAQPQFWARGRDPSDPYRGLLSVDIGSWNRDYRRQGCPWNLDASTIATLAWAQIQDHHDDAWADKYGPAVPFPRPMAYAIDQNLTFSSPKVDATPFLVNRTGAYKSRPGAIQEKRRDDARCRDERRVCESRYRLHAGRFVLAGTFMQTYTRLTSMEGANESARHAVNAILAAFHLRCEPCEIWDPEDHELPDLQWLKELDQQLFDRDLPHFTDILGWSELPDYLPEAELRGLVHRATR